MLTEEGKQRARVHMGYLSVQNSQTFVMGVPAAVQTQFIIEGAFDRLMPVAERDFYKFLDKLDRVLERIEESEENEEVDSVGDIHLKDKAFQKLVVRYRWWQAMLANLLGCPPNPFDMRWYATGAGGGGLNVPVNH